MSTLHLAFVHPATTRLLPASGRHVYDLASPGRVRAPWAGLRSSIGLRFLIRRAERQSLLRVDILHGPFGRVVAVLFGFHLAQYLGIPLFPLAMVNELKLSDAEIGLGTGIFYLAVLLGSMQLARISARLGHHRVAALGALALTAYPAILAISDGLGHFLVASLVGGLAWSLFGGALANYVLERAPEDDRAAHLAWYNLSLNAAILIGSMGGAMLGDLVVLPIALLLVACIRLLAALFLWRWG